MKNKLILFALLILIYVCVLESTNYIVDIEGSGDFTSIQSAISVASSSGDTIVVHPGRYFENLNYFGKDITITSLFRYTNNREYIYNTIIDGNQQGPCVHFINGESRDAVIDGFTIENGSGRITPTWVLGGGIIVITSDPTIKNCVIQNNQSKAGGGIYVESYHHTICTPLLSGNIIKNNKANMGPGGGIGLSKYSELEFDPINKNSVFNNIATIGHDICSRAYGNYYNVVLDTFTVATADPVFISIESDFNFQCDNAIYDSYINQDVYVAPHGSDLNDGLSPSTPFQTVSWAMSRVVADSLNPKTVHLAPGTYSKSLNNQFFPFNMRGYTYLKGAGIDETILDGENQGYLISSAFNCNNYTVSDLSLINTNYEGNTMSTVAIFSADGVTFERIKFSNVKEGFINYLPQSRYFNENSVFTVTDLIAENNYKHIIGVGAKYHYYTNIKISGNAVYYSDSYVYGVGPSPIVLAGPVLNPVRCYFDMYQLLLYDNESFLEPGWPLRLGVSGISLYEHAEGRLINSTLSDNLVRHRGGVIVYDSKDSSLDIYNSIIYGNTPNEIWFKNSTPPEQPNRLGVFYSNIENGEHAIKFLGADPASAIVVWGDGNIDSPPHFIEDFDYPYQIGAGSPCIDAGTLDIPNFTFSEFDLMGNPRIVGSGIDMGAYEFQGLSVDFSAEPVQGRVPLEVQFTDQSDGEVFSWAWDFDLDGNIDSYEQNPTYTYTLPGRYSVKLIINNGENYVVKENLIEVEPSSLDDIILPPITAISNPYPNPFRGKTLMNFQVNEPGMVKICVYNVKGQRVRTLMDKYSENAYHHIVWDGYDDKGKKASSGIYTMQVKYKNKVVDIKKVTLLK
ncbi:MAG: PKD domain-containing protein [Candidatus Cloacimonadales bacterium]|jgi:hypothetical protein|nr:PKD domain-containing protein [Candidatus Cloacimonadales bacterium]